MQLNIQPGYRVGSPQYARDATPIILLDGFEAYSTVKVFLISLLNANLADVIAATIVSRLLFIHGLKFVTVNLRDITNRVRCGFTKRVITQQLRLDSKTRQFVLIDRNMGNFLVIQLKLQWH